jgi:hypothetical protein
MSLRAEIPPQRALKAAEWKIDQGNENHAPAMSSTNHSHESFHGRTWNFGTALRLWSLVWLPAAWTSGSLKKIAE